MLVRPLIERKVPEGAPSTVGAVVWKGKAGYCDFPPTIPPLFPTRQAKGTSKRRRQEEEAEETRKAAKMAPQVNLEPVGPWCQCLLSELRTIHRGEKGRQLDGVLSVSTVAVRGHEVVDQTCEQAIMVGVEAGLNMIGVKQKGKRLSRMHITIRGHGGTEMRLIKNIGSAHVHPRVFGRASNVACANCSEPLPSTYHPLPGEGNERCGLAGHALPRDPAPPTTRAKAWSIRRSIRRFAVSGFYRSAAPSRIRRRSRVR